jgi:hypothetical protein
MRSLQFPRLNRSTRLKERVRSAVKSDCEHTFAEDGGERALDFAYRRGVVDDIETILKRAGVVFPINNGFGHGEDSQRLRELAEVIEEYFDS